MRKLLVKLNLARLRDHLSAQDGRRLNEQDLLDWLRDAGFKRYEEDWWQIDESDLGQLDPDEVLAARPMDEADDPPEAS